LNEKKAKIGLFQPNKIICEVNGMAYALTPEELAMVQKVTGRTSRKSLKYRKTRRYRRV